MFGFGSYTQTAYCTITVTVTPDVDDVEPDATNTGAAVGPPSFPSVTFSSTKSELEITVVALMLRMHCCCHCTDNVIEPPQLN